MTSTSNKSKMIVAVTAFAAVFALVGFILALHVRKYSNRTSGVEESATE